jgi:hypothetical protein
MKLPNLFEKDIALQKQVIKIVKYGCATYVPRDSSHILFDNIAHGCHSNILRSSQVAFYMPFSNTTTTDESNAHW